MASITTAGPAILRWIRTTIRTEAKVFPRKNVGGAGLLRLAFGTEVRGAPLSHLDSLIIIIDLTWMFAMLTVYFYFAFEGKA